MPWFDDESDDDKSLSNEGTMVAIQVDRAEKLDRYNKLEGIGKCFSCSYAFIYRTSQKNDPFIKCEVQSGEPSMPPNIVECNRYQEVGKLSLSQMSQLAKMVGEQEKRQAGFIQVFSANTKVTDVDETQG
jgi:hypothetical protein